MMKALLRVTPCLVLVLLSTVPARGESPSTVLESAILAVEHGRYTEALSQLATLPAASLSTKERKRARYLSGHAYLKLKRYPEALLAFGETLDQYPELGDYAIWNVARLYKEVNAVRLQLETLRLLLARFPQSRLVPQARMALARDLIEDTREPYEGVRILKEFLAQHANDPHVPAVYLLLGQGYEGLGLAEKASEAYRALYVQFPASPEADRAAARIEALLPPERRFPGGLTLFERLERADHLADAGECARAMQEAQDVSPPTLPRDLQARALSRLGLCAFKLRRYREAAATLDTFRQALFGDEHAAEALYILGTAHQREGRTAEAERIFLQLAAREPPTPWNAKALVALGLLYEARRDTKQAIDAYTQLATRFPTDDRADEMAWRIGWLRYGQKLFSAAVRDFATAAVRFPKSVFV
ncbi:MAG: tetratricopeptide repeat protein, partial [Nitrospinae bacterium]|nr:tetratricopeptide repeat protein [Nitrospinota bacterium]